MVLLFRCLLLLGALTFAVAAPSAQETSIETVPAPQGPSSGEAMPEEATPAEPATPPPCGTQPITMARMQWPTSALLTEIHARILKLAFDCEVRVQEGDMATVGSSMGANGQPAVAPEMWIARIAEIWNAAIKAQQVRQAGSSYAEQVFEGWFVPDYAVTRWPDIATVEGLKAHAGEMAGGLKPRFITCPIDWACNIINKNLLRANGLDQIFQVVEPANRFELDTLIAEAVGRKEAIVFYYWQPNAILAQFAFREVQLGAYSKDNFLCLGRLACPTPLPTGFAPDPVIVAVSEWVYEAAPQVASYFQKAKMPFAEMNAMLQQLSETGATVESVADRFIAERGAVWRPWAGLPVEPGSSAAPPVAGAFPSDGAPQPGDVPAEGSMSVEATPPEANEAEERAPREAPRVRAEPEPDFFEEDEDDAGGGSVIMLPPPSLAN